MTRSTVTLVSVVSFLFASALAIAEPRQRISEVRPGLDGPRDCPTRMPCASCTSQAPILERGRPPFPGEEGSGVDSCKLVNTGADWDAYCLINGITDCPILADSFFDQHTVVAVAIDTLTARSCEGSPDPLWKLDCVTTSRGSAAVRVVQQQPGAWCRCSAMPQQLQRLFLATAIPKTQARSCQACEEPHTIDCPR